MSTPRYLAIAICLAFLPSCANRPAKLQPAEMQPTVKPVTEVRHAPGATTTDQYQQGAYHHARGDHDLALQAYQAALTLGHRRAEALNAMIAIYQQRGQTTQAEAMLREAITQQPDAAYLRNNLGYILYLRGEHQAAVDELRTALRLDPKLDWARNNLEMAEAKFWSSQKPAQPVQPAVAPAQPVTPFEIWGEIDQTNIQPATIAAVPTVLEAAQPILTAQPLLPVSAEYQLEICNSSGVAGLAKRLTQALNQQGIAVNTITSKRPFRQLVTEIQYRDGFETEAKKLREKLNGRAFITRASSPLPTDIRIVLGRELNAHMASIEAQPDNTELAASIQLETASPTNTPFDGPVAAAKTPAHTSKVDALLSSAQAPIESTLFDQATKTKPYKLLVVNANGVRGIARKVSGFLHDKGVPVRSVSDEKPYRSATLIEYREGYLLEAARLRVALPNQPVIMKSKNMANADIKLVLGRDLAGKTDLFPPSAAKTQQAVNEPLQKRS